MIMINKSNVEYIIFNYKIHLQTYYINSTIHYKFIYYK